MMYRSKPDGNGKMVPDDKRSPAYFHTTDLACLCRLDELREIKMYRIYITNTSIETLTCLNVKLLKKCKMWNPLLKTRQQLCKQVTCTDVTSQV